MRKRNVAWIVICLTVDGTIAAQISSGNYHVRIHQHRASEVKTDIKADPLACVKETEISAYQYDNNAVDVNLLITHLPLVSIDTEENIPGHPYYEEGGFHRMYTVSSEGNEFITANMKIFSQDGQYHTLADDPDLKKPRLISEYAEIHPGGLTRAHILSRQLMITAKIKMYLSWVWKQITTGYFMDRFWIRH